MSTTNSDKSQFTGSVEFVVGAGTRDESPPPRKSTPRAYCGYHLGHLLPLTFPHFLPPLPYPLPSRRAKKKVSYPPFYLLPNTLYNSASCLFTIHYILLLVKKYVRHLNFSPRKAIFKFFKISPPLSLIEHLLHILQNIF